MNVEISLMEQFRDPNLIHSMSTGEKLMGGLMTTLMGMGITFAVLLLLWALIALMTKLVNKPEKVAPIASVAKATVGSSGASVITSISPDAGEEVIAVIAAAIVAFESEGTVSSNLNIQRINRASGRGTSWNSAGRAEVIESRRF